MKANRTHTWPSHEVHVSLHHQRIRRTDLVLQRLFEQTPGPENILIPYQVFFLLNYLHMGPEWRERMLQSVLDQIVPPEA